MSATVTWVTFASRHKHGRALVGVRFHIQRLFVINMAASSPCSRPTCTPAACFSFTDDSDYAVCTLLTCIGSQLGWSDRGPREWAEAGGLQPRALHSLFTAGIQKNPSDSLQKNRDAARATERVVALVSPYSETTNQTEDNVLNKEIEWKCQFLWGFFFIHCDLWKFRGISLSLIAHRNCWKGVISTSSWQQSWAWRVLSEY